MDSQQWTVVAVAIVALALLAGIGTSLRKAAQAKRERLAREGAFQQGIEDAFRTGDPSWQQIKDLASSHLIPVDRLRVLLAASLREAIVREPNNARKSAAFSRYLENLRFEGTIVGLPSATVMAAHRVANRLGDERADLNDLLTQMSQQQEALQAALVAETTKAGFWTGAGVGAGIATLLCVCLWSIWNYASSDEAGLRPPAQSTSPELPKRATAAP